MMAKDIQPFSIVEDVGFVNFAQHLLDISVKHGSMPVRELLYDRTSLAKTYLVKYYDKCVEKLKKKTTAFT